MRMHLEMRTRIAAGLLLAVTVPAFVLFGSSEVKAGAKAAKIRPIEDFVERQGTYCLSAALDCASDPADCLLFVPPFENYFGWGSFPPPPGDPNYLASFDYAGIAARKIYMDTGVDLGTTFSGQVRERPLKDGRAEVKVILHTENALAWANQCCDFATDPVIFGARSTEVLAGVEATLGKFFMDFTFINTAPEAPLPDLIQLVYCPEPEQELRYLRVSASAEGPLTEAFGVPDGTPGKLTVSETGLFHTGFNGAVGDAFPAEHVIVRAIGAGSGESENSSVTGAPSWTASPNPITCGASLSFAYQVPQGGANVSVGIYSVTGRRVASLADGFQAGGSRKLSWSGRTAEGTMAAPGIYFLRARVADVERTLRLVVMP